jgi:hypothetical protein
MVADGTEIYIDHTLQDGLRFRALQRKQGQARLQVLYLRAFAVVRM